MIAALVIIHGLLAIALLGAITHQGFSAWRKPAPARLFVDRFRAVPSLGYTNAVVVLYLITFAFGAYIYPTFVLDVKASVSDAGMRSTIGVFQIKEHVAVIGLALLPAYWHYWKRAPLTVNLLTRRVLTGIIMLSTWWSLVIGHVLNNVRGLI
jgi:hypothetical protein